MVYNLFYSLREKLKKREGLKIDLKIEDLHFYLSPFIKHPALKLAFTVIHTIIELKS